MTGLYRSTWLDVLVQKWFGGAGSLIRNNRTFLTGIGLACRFENVLEGAGNLLRNDCTGSQDLDWRVGSKMA